MQHQLTLGTRGESAAAAWRGACGHPEPALRRQARCGCEDARPGRRAAQQQRSAVVAEGTQVKITRTVNISIIHFFLISLIQLLEGLYPGGLADADLGGESHPGDESAASSVRRKGFQRRAAGHLVKARGPAGKGSLQP